jgi:hypothetical protein
MWNYLRCSVPELSAIVMRQVIRLVFQFETLTTTRKQTPFMIFAGGRSMWMGRRQGRQH